ncbi:MAG: hypothetical protein ACRDBQ_18390 [Shewanella sp.]
MTVQEVLDGVGDAGRDDARQPNTDQTFGYASRSKKYHGYFIKRLTSLCELSVDCFLFDFGNLLLLTSSGLAVKNKNYQPLGWLKFNQNKISSIYARVRAPVSFRIF